MKPGRRTQFLGTFGEALAEKTRTKQAFDAARTLGLVARPDGAGPVVVSAEPPAPVLPTLTEYAHGLLSAELAPQSAITLEHYEGPYRLRVHPVLGGVRLDAITKAMVRSWWEDIVRVHGDRDLALNAYKALYWILERAVADDLIDANVVAGVPHRQIAQAAVRAGAPSAEDHERKKPTLNRPQYERLKAHAESVSVRDLVLVRLAVEGTLRRAELVALWWEDFDPTARVFQVKKGVTATRKTKRARHSPKTRQSVRAIVLSRDLCDLLAAYREACRRAGHGGDQHYLFPGYVEYALRQVVPTLPISPRTMTGWACGLVRDAGLVDERGEHLTDLQGLRASGASIADAAGVPESIIEAQLGHRGSSTYRKHYRNVSTAPERFQFADVFEPAPLPGVDQRLISASAKSARRGHLRVV